LLGYDWKLPRKPLPSKLEELASYKAALRETARETQAAAKTEWRRLLENYANWSALTPQHFETAVSLRLEEEGYRVSVTKYSKDGGVDIEATDQDGRAVIVQAKRYTKNVGVSVVREMIGVRESRENRPHTIIYSLAGFSRDARRLAAEAGIELRDVKQELLKV
jgi:HJR/Mrr/RecB family endonuclease